MGSDRQDTLHHARTYFGPSRHGHRRQAARGTRQALMGVSRYLIMVSYIATLVACGSGPTVLPTASAGANVYQRASVTVAGFDLPGRLLFASRGDIWLWQGNQGHQVTARGDLAQPAWAPDGTRLAAVQRGPSFSDIVVLPINQPDQVMRLTAGDSSAPPNSAERAASTTWSLYPAFAPDGATVAFAAQPGPASGEPAVDQNLALYTMPAIQGSELRQRFSAEDQQVGRLAYGANGQLVFTMQPLGPAPAQIMQVSADTIEPIAGMPEQSYDPTFSADGTWLVFAVRAGSTTDIFALPATGGSPTQLTTNGAARAPAVSPDGKWLAFLALTPGGSSFDVSIAPLTINANGVQAGEPRTLTSGMQIDADSGLAWGKP